MNKITQKWYNNVQMKDNALCLHLSEEACVNCVYRLEHKCYKPLQYESDNITKKNRGLRKRTNKNHEQIIHQYNFS